MTRTIVMVHGMWATPSVWESFRSYFEALGWTVIAPALRYHRSDATAPEALGTTSLLDYVEDVADAIAALPDKPVVLGHSMGGLIAQHIVARGLASAAVLLCPAPPAGILALHPSVLWAFARIQLRWGWWRKPHLPSRAAAFWGSFNTMSRTDGEAQYAAFVPDSGRVLLEIGLPFLDRRRAARIDPVAVKVPMLVIGAELDRLVPAATVRAIARRYQTAVHREFPGQGHFVVAQPGWQEVAQAAAQWLEAATSRTSTRGRSPA